MKVLIDLQVNKADDIIIQNEDILFESNYLVSVSHCCQRRLSAREDDFYYTPDISAALERYNQNTINSFLINSIETSINLSLTTDALLNNSDYKVYIQQQDQTKLQIYFAISIPGISENNVPDGFYFNVLVNQQTQRNYR